jgi:ribosome-associated protein
MPRRLIPTDPTADVEEDLTSRTDRRKERLAEEEALMSLAETLAGLSEQALARLDLPESVLDPVADARLVRSGAARNRALRLVRAALRDLEHAQLRRIRDAVPEPRRGRRG